MSALDALTRILEVRRWGRREALPADYDAVDLRRDYRRVLLDDEAGRRVLADLLQKTRLWETSFSPDSAHATSFHEGCRSIGLAILEMFETAPGAPAIEHEPPEEEI